MGKSNDNTRDYNCKDEELIPICRFLAYSFNRDLPDFTGYSSKLGQAYATGYQFTIDAAAELVSPTGETNLLTGITSHLYGNMKALRKPVKRLEGYIKLSKGAVPVSPAGFGIKKLRDGLNNGDAEKVVDALKLVNGNIAKYGAELAEQGFTADQAGFFADMQAAIDADNQQQYAIISARKLLVQANIGLLNGLFGQTREILSIGKVLYEGTDPVKLQEYSFQYLLRKVRQVPKPPKKDKGKGPQPPVDNLETAKE